MVGITRSKVIYCLMTSYFLELELSDVLQGEKNATLPQLVHLVQKKKGSSN